jgi:hypothetical protein
MSDRSGETDEGERPAVSEERIATLEERIEELSDELKRPPRGPLGLPRPPTPGELLAFVDDHAIPTTIAILEANVRALKALRGAVGLLRRTEERDLPEAGRLRDRTDSVAREAVTELDRAVSDLATAIEGEALPDNEAARSVLQEIRAVRDEVAGALEESTNGSEGGTGETADANDDGGTENGDIEDDGGVDIDVESELESIKDEMDPEDPYADGSGSPKEDDGGPD